jgi:hypothetical protein
MFQAIADSANSKQIFQRTLSISVMIGTWSTEMAARTPALLSTDGYAQQTPPIPQQQLQMKFIQTAKTFISETSE